MVRVVCAGDQVGYISTYLTYSTGFSGGNDGWTGRHGETPMYDAVQPCPFLARLAVCLPWVLRPRMDPCPILSFWRCAWSGSPHSRAPARYSFPFPTLIPPSINMHPLPKSTKRPTRLNTRDSARWQISKATTGGGFGRLLSDHNHTHAWLLPDRAASACSGTGALDPGLQPSLGCVPQPQVHPGRPPTKGRAQAVLSGDQVLERRLLLLAAATARACVLGRPSDREILKPRRVSAPDTASPTGKAEGRAGQSYPTRRLKRPRAIAGR